jgi:CcmD family protein
MTHRYQTKLLASIFLASIYFFSVNVDPIVADDDGEVHIPIIVAETPVAETPKKNITNGFITNVVTNEENTTIISVTESNGETSNLKINPETNIGIESVAGERWVSIFSENPQESISKLKDQQRRLIVLTVVHDGESILSISDADKRDLELNLQYLFIVFITAWIVFFAYTFYLSRRQNAINRDIKLLKSQSNYEK